MDASTGLPALCTKQKTKAPESKGLIGLNRHFSILVSVASSNRTQFEKDLEGLVA